MDTVLNQKEYKKLDSMNKRAVPKIVFRNRFSSKERRLP